MRDGSCHECYLCVDDDVHQCRIALSILKGFQAQVDLKARSPLQGEWSVDEDRLLLAAAEAQEHELLPLYRLARKENPRLFNKQSAGEHHLREHVRLLKASPELAYRSKLLQRELNSQATLAEEGDPAPVESPAEAFSRLPRLHKNVVIRLVPREGKAQTVEGNAQALGVCSKYLAALLEAAPSDRSDSKTIEISEKDRAFTGVSEMFGVLDAENVSRYVDISENPQLWANREKALEQLAAAKQRQHADWERYRQRLVTAKELHLTQLSALRQQEEQELAERLGHCLQEDLQQLRYLHEAHQRLELDKLHKRYRAVMDDVQGFYESEETKMNALHLRHNDTDRVAVEQQLAEAEHHLRALLPDKQLPRLLLLAEVLKDGDLRGICLQRIAGRMTRFAKCPELGCQLLRSTTIEELLSLCSTEQLVTVLRGEGYQFQATFLRKEIAYRQAQLLETYRDWALPQLTAAQVSEAEPFPELIEQEIDRRLAGGVPYVNIDIKKLNPNLVLLDADRRVATLVKAHKYAVIVGTVPREQNGWGKWYWECRILAFERLHGCTVSVGFDLPRANYQESWVPGLQAGPDGHGVMWTSDGLLHHNGISEDIGCHFDKDDVVGVGLDQDRHRLTFYKNGQPVPLARRQPDFPLPAVYHFLPAVCMYTARPKQSVRVAVDFGGPFETGPPKFFRPYGSTNPAQSRPEGW